MKNKTNTKSAEEKLAELARQRADLEQQRESILKHLANLHGKGKKITESKQ